MASRLQDVILRGDRASQPLATTVASGTLYYVIDEQVTERASDSATGLGVTWEDYTDAGGGGGGGITSLTGDVTGTGPGATATTIANDAVTYAKMQNVSSADRLLGRGNGGGAGNVEEIILGVGLVLTGPLLDLNTTLLKAIGFTIDGGGSPITVGIKGDIYIPFDCTIMGVTLIADTSTTSIIDIWKDAFPTIPDNADSITAAAPPTLSGSVTSQDLTLTGWTTAITGGDILRFNVDSNNNATRINLTLTVIA